MPTFVDTHTHPYYCDDPEGFVNRALEAGVTTLVMPNVDCGSIAPMFQLAEKYPGNLYMAMGLHPTEIKEDADEVLQRILVELNKENPFIAVGEIGIDLYWDKSFREKQMELFEEQLSKAVSLNLPAIIHCREGLDETLEVLQRFKDIKAVFHSFGGTSDDVERILSQNRNAYFGINGIVTFKNSKLRETIPIIPQKRILLETDSPYLAPVPHRGRPNESSYLSLIGRTVADCLNTDLEDIAELTTKNAADFFNAPFGDKFQKAV